MKKVILSVLIVMVYVILPAQNKIKNISDEAKFYLITCEPGDAVYARFGHSGLRIYDPINKIDDVFHWGLFSFDTPNFISRFISGNTDYEMGVFSTKYFMREYIERGSSVYAQELDLTPEQKYTLWTKLWNNYLPENRKYRYNFIYDNCATRPYQLILSTYDYKVTLNTHLHQITYRDIINKYIPVGSLLNTGINLIIGSQADKNITPKESVSFPLYTMDALKYTNYLTNDNKKHPIVKKEEIMYLSHPKNNKTDNLTFYISIIIPLILTLISLFYTIKKKRYIPYLSQIILFTSGIVGIIISYLWFFSHHPLVNDNMNLLWCNPLNIILAILLFIRKKIIIRKIKIILSTLSLILCIIFLGMLITDIQTTTPQIFSIWVLIIVINATIVYTYKSKFKKLFYKK